MRYPVRWIRWSGRTRAATSPRGRGHVVVEAPVLVVEPDQQRVLPVASVHDRADDAGDERLTHADVRVLLVAVGRTGPVEGVADGIRLGNARSESAVLDRSGRL